MDAIAINYNIMTAVIQYKLLGDSSDGGGSSDSGDSSDGGDISDSTNNGTVVIVVTVVMVVTIVTVRAVYSRSLQVNIGARHTKYITSKYHLTVVTHSIDIIAFTVYIYWPLQYTYSTTY